MNLYSQLEKIVKIQPSHDAIEWETGVISYFEFYRLANSIAFSLNKKFKLKHGHKVALVMENSFIFLPILFGIWKAGLVAVPINAKLHKKELSWIFNNSEAKLVFCSKSKAPDIETNLPVIVTFSKDFKVHTQHEDQINIKTDISDSAWIFYTSGTTGKPKGAELTHRNLLTMSLTYFADVDTITEIDTRLHAAPMTHGSGIYSLPFILKGAKNFICQSNFEPDEIFQKINLSANVSFFAAPSMVKRLSSHSLASSDLSGLKTLEFGGAPMYLSDTRAAIEVFGNSLYQLYGQGEAPMTISNITKAMYSDHKKENYEKLLLSAGIARTGCDIAIVNSDWETLPNGEIGEIVTKSDCVMKGYYKNEKATEEALKDGWLSTGDLGSIDENGLLTIKDRSKDMIISGGMNVYPREVEDVLLLHNAVKEVAVIGLDNERWGEVIVAVVVQNYENPNIESELDTLCLQNLARFKRPKNYFFKNGLPKNNYGKILKTDLRKEFKNETC